MTSPEDMPGDPDDARALDAAPAAVEVASAGIAERELVPLAAMTISLVALSIDAMLPALADIGRELAVGRTNDSQLVVGVFFLGLAFGQMLFGPASDSLGRRPAIHAGFAIFLAGSLLTMWAGDFTALLAGRLLQGIGSAGPRTVMMAVVRDLFEGRAMARILSLVMTVFIVVPALAPALGQGVMLVSGWRTIFVALFGYALVCWVWFALRLPETLRPERRAPLTLARIGRAIRETVTTPVAAAYTFAGGLVFGAFVGYLSSAPQIFEDIYGLGHLFPAAFAACALSLGLASFVNARLVGRFGMRLLSRRALEVLTLWSFGFLLVVWGFSGVPPLWLLFAYMLPAFFMIGVLFGNFNALAMEPLGHIAGVAAAVIASLTTLASTLIGGAIGQAFDGTVVPLVGGFGLLGLASLVVVHLGDRRA
ncbi:MAG: multidrug effflux MFS transporter [Hyphomicrobiaceae bacterium]